jgi:Tol biopolymer transport system component
MRIRPAISPDGLFVAYVSRKYGEQDKLIVQASNGTKVELAQGARIDFPGWSPDGSEVLFLRRDSAPGEVDQTAKGTGIYTREDRNSNVWRIDLPAAGKKAKPEISRLTSGTSFYGAPSFSSDSRWVAFPLGPNPDETNIFKMEVAGGEPVQVTFFEHAMTASPAWSPDGQRIAFISDQNGTPRVWQISANGGAAQVLENTKPSDTNDNLAWWPSRDIVYQQPGQRHFLQISDKTHEEKQLVQNDQSVGSFPHQPAFSPDGKKMAVHWNRPDKRGIWIISLEPYSEILLLSGLIYPVGWSPDGEYVYAIRAYAASSGRQIIRVQVIAPNEAASVATLPGDLVSFDTASVILDGKEIVVSVSEEKSYVWLMENIDPSAARR